MLTYIWKRDTIAEWIKVRSCFPEFAPQWLAEFQAKEPDARFMICKHKPKRK